VPADELDEQRAALGQRSAAEFQAHDAVAAQLLERDELGAGELAGERAEERAERTLVQLDARVLQVQARRLRIGREPQAQDAPAARRFEHQQEVGRRESVHVAHAGVLEEGRELAHELADVRRGEVQASSSSTL
jgi:hypothetical protein